MNAALLALEVPRHRVMALFTAATVAAALTSIGVVRRRNATPSGSAS